MYRIGVHSHLFRGRVDRVAAAARAHALDCVQLTPNFPDLRFVDPGQVTPERCRAAAEPFWDAGVAIVAVSGGTDLLDDDLARRHQRILRLHALIRNCRHFGVNRLVAQLGGGSTPLPEVTVSNRTPEAWSETRLVLGEALRLAAEHGTTLLIKPSLGDRIQSIEDAVRLRSELEDDALAFVMDPAVYLAASVEGRPLGHRELCTRLASWAPLVHAKDLRVENGHASTPRVGCGELNYGVFFEHYPVHHPAAPVILEHVRPEELGDTRKRLEEAIASFGTN